MTALQSSMECAAGFFTECFRKDCAVFILKKEKKTQKLRVDDFRTTNQDNRTVAKGTVEKMHPLHVSFTVTFVDLVSRSTTSLCLIFFMVS